MFLTFQYKGYRRASRAEKSLFFDLHFCNRFWPRDIARSTRNVLLYSASGKLSESILSVFKFLVSRSVNIFDFDKKRVFKATVGPGTMKKR